ncbi:MULTISPECIES: cytochrome P450 [unclassified Modestobacter]
MSTAVPHVDPEAATLDELGEARERSWVATSDRGVEILRYAEGFEALRHPKLEKGHAWPRRLDIMGITDGPVREQWERMLICVEGPGRTHLRVPLSRLLRPRQVEALRGVARRIAHDVLDEIDDPSDVDFMQQICWKLPPRMYCHLVSAPVEFAQHAARLSDSCAAPVLTADLSRRQEHIDGMAEAFDFVGKHVASRRGHVGDDFTSLMIQQQEAGLLTEQELVDEGVSLMIASIDNTVNQAGLMFGELLDRPAVWQRVAADPSLVPAAVEETIRFRPRFGTIFRLAVEDIELFDRHVPAGTWVYVSVRTAQRDPRVWTDPDVFDIDRGRVAPLMFGNGIYNCLGQHLVRIELQELVGVLAERYPQMRLTRPWTRWDTNAVTEVRDVRVSLTGQ